MKFRLLTALCLSALTLSLPALAAAPVPNPPAVDTKGYVLMDFRHGVPAGVISSDSVAQPRS